jgi:segregation and condensation protein A
MEIKSKMLLPRPEETGPDEADPRLELVRQLIEYKKFKDAAALLEAQAEHQLSRVPRRAVEPALPDPAQAPLRSVELWDLVSAFGRLMRETLALQPQQILVDETPLQIHMDHILDRLLREPRLPFADLFTPPHSRGRLVGLFLALLELIKTHRAQAEQQRPFDPIYLVACP